MSKTRLNSDKPDSINHSKWAFQEEYNDNSDRESMGWAHESGHTLALYQSRSGGWCIKAFPEKVEDFTGIVDHLVGTQDDARRSPIESKSKAIEWVKGYIEGFSYVYD